MTGIQGSGKGRRNWNNIFSKIFNYSENELDSYLDEFAKINIVVSHNKDELIKVDQQDIIYSFIQKSIRFMKCLNKAYKIILDADCFQINTNDCYFSYCKFIDRSDLTPLIVTETDLERFIEYIKEKDEIKLKL